MRQLNLPIRVVLYRESGLWVAHCLEFDLLGCGETREDSIACLQEAIVLQLEASLDVNNPANLFRPASSETFHRFAMGKEFDCNTFSAQISIQFEDVDIPSCTAREYVDGGNELAMA